MVPTDCIAFPMVDGVLFVWGSLQVPIWNQSMIQAATGLPKREIMINASVIDGDFGDKLVMSLHAVTASCIAAQRFGKPGKLVLNRDVVTVICASQILCSSDY